MTDRVLLAGTTLKQYPDRQADRRLTRAAGIRESGMGAISWVQKLLTALSPRSLAGDVEAASRTWMLRCPSGHERSVWEAGGIRWGAAGRPKRLLRCPDCGRLRWHTTYRKPVDDPATGNAEAGPN